MSEEYYKHLWKNSSNVYSSSRFADMVYSKFFQKIRKFSEPNNPLNDPYGKYFSTNKIIMFYCDIF